jgi:hypothetical protein
VIITEDHYSVCNSVGIYDRIIPSVYIDWITDEIYIIWKKKKRFDDVEVFAADLTDGLTEGFKTGSPYSDVTNSPSELPMESPTEWVRWWFHWQKLIYHHSTEPLLPYFSFFFPLPICKHLPPKNISLLSTQVIFV